MKLKKWALVFGLFSLGSTLALAQTSLKVQTLASMPGKNPEGIGYGADGAGSMELMRYKNGTAEVFAKLPIHALVAVASPSGFVVDGHIDVDRSKPGAMVGAGRLVAVDEDGVVTKVVNVGSLPNGLVRLREDVYLATDSNEGKIWRVDMAQGQAYNLSRARRGGRRPASRYPLPSTISAFEVHTYETH